MRPVLKARLRFWTVSECNSQYEDALEQGKLLGLGNEAALMARAEAALPGKTTAKPIAKKPKSLKKEYEKAKAKV